MFICALLRCRNCLQVAWARSTVAQAFEYRMLAVGSQSHCFVLFHQLVRFPYLGEKG
jgi:hypothetical protein